MWRRIVLLATVLIALLSGCGDGVLLISVNSGTVFGPPRCAAGQFDLLQQGGLTVLVVLTSNTHFVFVGGGGASCANLSADASVQVSGRRSGDQIVASTVTIE